MKRNILTLADKHFDVLIVGSGIYGAFLAREASLRGLQVALIEQGDFGAATSANSLKVVHGGLRYLQHLNLLRMRESIRARRQLLTIAPYLVKPKKFIVPTYGWGMQSKWLMRAALLVNDIISMDRNKCVAAEQRIPAGKVLSRSQCLSEIPGVEQHSLSGAAQWSDGFIEDTERFMIAIVHSAAELGASVANYVSAQSYIIQDGRVTGVTVQDRLTGQEFSIQARSVINAAGPGAAALNSSLHGQQDDGSQTWVKAFNVYLNRPLFNEAGIGLSSTTHHTDNDAVINRGKRLYFFVPWKGGTLVGTDYVAVDSNAAHGPLTLDDRELAVIIDEVNALYPAAAVSKKDIGFCHVGLLPAGSNDLHIDAAARLLKHTRVLDHQQASCAIAGLFTVTGIKYTVAPQVAIDVIDRLAETLGIKAVRPAKEPPLYGAENDVNAAAEREPAVATDTRLQQRYGCRQHDVMKIAQNEKHCAEQISRQGGTLAAEVIYAIREEMAVTLSDVVYRRTGLAENGLPDKQEVLHCAKIMATELDWSEQHMKEEINALARHCKC